MTANAGRLRYENELPEGWNWDPAEPDELMAELERRGVVFAVEGTGWSWMLGRGRSRRPTWSGYACADST